MSSKASSIKKPLTIADVKKFVESEGYRYVHVVRPTCKHKAKRFGTGVIGTYTPECKIHALNGTKPMMFINDFTTVDKTNKIKSDFIFWDVVESEFELVSSYKVAEPTNKWTNKWDNSLHTIYEHKVAERGKEIPALLYDLLIHKTPHESELIVIDIILDVVRKLKRTYVVDASDNVIVNVPNKDGTESETVFSSHTDTVHRNAGEITLHVTTGPKADNADFVFAMEDGQPSVLGADDKVGVYIMLELLKVGTPGMYIFHAGEERGCVGSKWIVKNTPALVKGKKRMVAFDRMHYGDVIDRQRGGVCCSNAFTTALSARMNTNVNIASGGGLKEAKYNFKATTGVVTDSAEYIHLIPECTNLSVGYFEQHSKRERFDLFWLEDILLPSLKKIEWDTLPTSRDNTRALAVTYTNHTHVGKFVGTRSDYKTEMPASFAEVAAWKPSYGAPLAANEILANNMIRKWTYKYSVDMLKDVKEVLMEKENLEDTVGMDVDLLLDIQGTMADMSDKLSKCKLLREFQELAVELQATIHDTSLEIMDTDSVVNHLDGIAAMEEAAAAKAEQERVAKEALAAKPLSEQMWRMKSVTEKSVFLPEYPPAGFLIEYDVWFNILYVNNKVSKLYSKKGREIKDVHRSGLPKGTKLFAKLGTVTHHVFTVKETVPHPHVSVVHH